MENPAVRTDESFEKLLLGIGLDPEKFPQELRDKLRDDPGFAYHVSLCSRDPEMMDLIMRPYQKRTDLGSGAMLISAVAAYARWLSDGARTISDEQFLVRTRICSSCPHAVKPGGTVVHRLAAAFGTKQVCGLCGCDIYRKARLPTEKCPDVAFGPEGRWLTGGQGD